MKIAVSFVIIAVSLVLSAIVWAEQQIGKEQVQLTARFNEMASDTDWKVRTSNGGVKQKWLLHQVKVRKIEARLKAGERVDSREIEKILQDHSR